jgi:hypothetical protein
MVWLGNREWFDLITRSYDALGLNKVLNHPSVLPWVSIPGINHLDLTPVIEDHRNHLLKGTDGFFLATYEEPGMYEIHTQFYPWAKAKQTIIEGAEALKYAAKAGMKVLVTRVPQNNKAADWYARRQGFKHWFTNKNVWPTNEGLVDLSFYRYFLCPQ